MNICTQPYISPLPVYERVRLNRFTGRSWVIAEIDAAMRQHDRGYIVLEAAAGMGKTSLLAHLVHQRGYIHLFVEQAPGLDNLANGLRTLAAQIIRAWKLQSWLEDDLLPGMATRHDFLHHLIYVAARRRDQIQPGEPIILVIDGLESAGALPGQNVLNLPPFLPKGVYVILSQRPASLAFKTEAPCITCSLVPDDPRNMEDIHYFLEQEIGRPAFANAIYNGNSLPEYVVESLYQKCRGSWDYLIHAIEMIEQHAYPSNQSLDTFLQTLPESRAVCYARYWSSQQERAPGTSWRDVSLPTLATLCALMESVPRSTLAVLAGLDFLPSALCHILDEQWQSLLTIERAGVEPRYRMGNASMRDFLTGAVNWDELNRQERAITEQLVSATRQAHNRIASYYLDGWGGMDHGLHKLADVNRKNIVFSHSSLAPEGVIENSYGMRHMVAHLEQTGRQADVHRLLQLTQAEPEQPTDTHAGLFGWLNHVRQWLDPTPADAHRHLVWYAAREQEGDLSDFLCDVAQAWYLAERQKLPDRFCLQCCYALITASINSLASILPLPILTALLEKGVWSPTQALVYIQAISNDTEQAGALAAVAPYLTDERMMGTALAIARAIHDEQERARAIVGLAPLLPDTLLREAMKAAHAIHYPSWRTAALVGIVPYLPPEDKETVCKELLETIRTIWHGHDQVDALNRLAPHLSEPLLDEALTIARSILDTTWRVEALIGLAPSLPKPLLRDALALWEVWSAGSRASVLASLAPQLSEMGETGTALESVCSMKNEQDQAVALTGLAPYLSEPQLNEAFDLTQSMTQEQDRLAALVGMAPHFPRILLREALTNIRAMKRAAHRVSGIASLMPHLPLEEHTSLIAEMMDSVRLIESRDEQTHTIAELAATLSRQGYIQEALQTIPVIEDRQGQTQVIATLAPYLPDSLLQNVLSDGESLHHTHQKTQALACLAPYLPEPLLRRALDAARAIGDDSEQHRTLAVLAPYLHEPMIQRILRDVQDGLGEQDGALILVDLAPYLSEPLLREALDIAQAFERGDDKRIALCGLAPLVSASLVPRLFESVKSLTNELDRATALATIVPLLPETLLRDVLDSIRAIRGERERSLALVALIPHAPEPLLRNIPTDAHKFTNPDYQSAVLAVLAPCLSRQGHWRQALDEAWSIGKADERVMALVQIAPALPHVLLRDILAAVRTTGQQDVRARALAEIRLCLPEEDRPYVLDDILKAALAAKWQGRASPSAIIPLLKDSDVLEKVLLSVQMIDSPGERAARLAELAGWLPEPLKQQALHSALVATHLVWGHYRAEALAHLAPSLPAPLLETALKEAQSLEREEWRAVALTGIVPFLPQPLAVEAAHEPLKAAQATWNVQESVHALVHLVPYLPLEEQQAVLEGALVRTCAVDDTTERFEALALLAPCLVALPVERLQGLWDELLHTLANRSRHNLLSDLRALFPLIVALGGKEAVQQVASAIVDVGQWFT